MEKKEAAKTIPKNNGKKPKQNKNFGIKGKTTQNFIVCVCAMISILFSCAGRGYRETDCV